MTPLRISPVGDEPPPMGGPAVRPSRKSGHGHRDGSTGRQMGTRTSARAKADRLNTVLLGQVQGRPPLDAFFLTRSIRY